MLSCERTYYPIYLQEISHISQEPPGALRSLLITELPSADMLGLPAAREAFRKQVSRQELRNVIEGGGKRLSSIRIYASAMYLTNQSDVGCQALRNG